MSPPAGSPHPAQRNRLTDIRVFHAGDVSFAGPAENGGDLFARARRPAASKARLVNTAAGSGRAPETVHMDTPMKTPAVVKTTAQKSPREVVNTSRVTRTDTTRADALHAVTVGVTTKPTPPRAARSMSAAPSCRHKLSSM